MPLYGAPQGSFRGDAIAVGTFAPNGFGLFDMHGNVSEWTCTQRVVDYNGEELRCYSGTENAFRMIRGGDYRSTADDIRSASRKNDLTTRINQRIGFWLARD